MNVVFRASDIGFSDIYDIGIFRAIDEGIITSANVMLDGNHVKEALLFLKERPWISIEWQRNLWEKSVLSHDEIPTLVDENGYFLWGHDHASPYLKMAKYEECYKEFEAEILMCKELAGRFPVCSGTFSFEGELERAYQDVCKKYGILINPYQYDLFPDHKGVTNPKYKMVVLGPDMLKNKESVGYDLAYYYEYDPIHWIQQMDFNEDMNYLITMHPGFVDDHVATYSSMTLHRVKEYMFATSPEIKEWIVKMNFKVLNQESMLKRLGSI